MGLSTGMVPSAGYTGRTGEPLSQALSTFSRRTIPIGRSLVSIRVMTELLPPAAMMSLFLSFSNSPSRTASAKGDRGEAGAGFERIGHRDQPLEARVGEVLPVLGRSASFVNTGSYTRSPSQGAVPLRRPRQDRRRWPVCPSPPGFCKGGVSPPASARNTRTDHW